MTRKQRAKKQPKNPTAADLPQNPEFQEFAANLRQIMSVPKSDIDRLLAERKASTREPNDPDDVERMDC